MRECGFNPDLIWAAINNVCAEKVTYTPLETLSLDAMFFASDSLSFRCWCFAMSMFRTNVCGRGMCLRHETFGDVTHFQQAMLQSPSSQALSQQELCGLCKTIWHIVDYTLKLKWTPPPHHWCDSIYFESQWPSTPQWSSNKQEWCVVPPHKDVNARVAAISHFSDADWWTWKRGSTLFFWPWHAGEQRQSARDGMPIWICSRLPRYCRMLEKGVFVKYVLCKLWALKS
jgi:hypothetical protein